jgi:hypothetical protein
MVLVSDCLQEGLHTNANRSRWQIMCNLRDKILEVNGSIFGGFVRDSILHDHYAKQYFDVCNNIMTSIDNETSTNQYSNPTFLSETKDRLTIPNDIDCHMHETDFPTFMSSLWKDRLCGKLIYQRKAGKYINGFPSDTSLKHRRISVEINFHELLLELNRLPIEFDRQALLTQLKTSAPSPIFIDVITSSQPYPEPFFTDPDFECNTLYITKHGISVSYRVLQSSNKSQYAKFVKMKAIIDDIIEKKAVYLHPYGTHENMPQRVAKLLSNGWSIVDKYNCITYVHDSAYEGHCIICHDKLPDTHIKLPCCDARYHSHCLGKTIRCSTETEQRCIMCKSATNFYITHTFLLDREPHVSDCTMVLVDGDQSLLEYS